MSGPPSANGTASTTLGPGVDDAEGPGCSRSARYTAPRPDCCWTGSASVPEAARSTSAAARRCARPPRRAHRLGRVRGRARPRGPLPGDRPPGARRARARRTVELREGRRDGDGAAARRRSTSSHERLVLNNVPDPGAVVAEMVRLTRPGGHVALQDVDWMTWTCLPEHADWDRLADCGRASLERRRADRSAAAHAAARGRPGRRAGTAPPARVPPGRAVPPAAGAVRRAAPRAHPRRWRDYAAEELDAAVARLERAPGRHRHRRPSTRRCSRRGAADPHDVTRRLD